MRPAWRCCCWAVVVLGALGGGGGAAADSRRTVATAGFVLRGVGPRTGPATPRQTRVDGSVGAADLWQGHPKPLLRIGRNGVQDSHVRSLRELAAAHKVVRVKVSDGAMDGAKLGEDLAARSGLRLVAVHPSGRHLLFGAEAAEVGGGTK